MALRFRTILVLALICGCRRGASSTADASPAPSTSPSNVLASSSPERAWAEARDGDPLELARLANLEGVHKLAEVAGNETASAEDRATAIRAIAFVQDPTPALEALTRLVSDASLDRSTLALQTLAAVAPRRAPIEELEPGSWRTCADGLLAALKTIQGPVRRELAIRALHGLADRGAVAKSAIPVR